MEAKFKLVEFLKIVGDRDCDDHTLKTFYVVKSKIMGLEETGDCLHGDKQKHSYYLRLSDGSTHEVVCGYSDFDRMEAD